MLDAAGEIVATAQAVDLRPAGHARLHEVAGQVVGDFAGEAFDVVRALGARADQAHVSAQDVPELREFVEIPAAEEGTDTQQSRVAVRSAHVDMIRCGGVGFHAAEFPEREVASVGAHAYLREKYRSVGGLAFDEHGEDGENRQREDESDPCADHVDEAFKCAAEEAVDGEFFDPENRQAADGLEAQAADENLEGGRDDLPVNEGLFTGFDDGVELLARQVGASGDENVDLVCA